MSGFLTVEEVMNIAEAQLVMPTNAPQTEAGDALLAHECRDWSPDSREVAAGGVFIAVGGGEQFSSDAAERGALIALASSAVPELPALIVENVQAALCRLAQYRRTQLDMPVIAIAGSSGKTSTKNLLAAALTPLGHIHASKRSFNNEIGVPITVLECPVDAGALVVECGERKIGDLAYLGSILTPDGVVITSLGSAHAEYLGGPDGVARECGDLIARARQWVVAWAEDAREVLHFVPSGIDVLVALRGDERASDDLQVAVRLTSLDLNDRGQATIAGDTSRGSFATTIGLLGRHQARNAVLALGAATECRVAPAEAAIAVQATVPEHGRGDLRVREDGLRIIDDTYNANPDSMRAGIDLLAEVPSERRVAILGEIRELGDTAEAEHESLGAYAAREGIDLLIALGPYRGALQAGFESQAGATSATVSITSLEEIPQYVAAGDLVLVKASRGARLERVVDLLMEVPK